MKSIFQKISVMLFAGFVFVVSGFVDQSMNAAPGIDEISVKGDRNLKIISNIYNKYSFMPAKRSYFNNINEEWVRGKVLYSHATPEEKKQKFDKVVQSYKLTNDVLKDICIDLANLSEIVMDDYTQKLIESENKKTNLARDKHYNRYLVSRNEFSRAEHGFRGGMFYYSARLYDHGLTLMKTVYSEQGWVFPKSQPAGENKVQTISAIINKPKKIRAQ